MDHSELGTVEPMCEYAGCDRAAAVWTADGEIRCAQHGPKYDPTKCAIEHGPSGYHCTLPPGHRGPFCYVDYMFFNASTCEHTAEHVDQRTLGGCDSWCNQCGVALYWNAGRSRHYPSDGIPF